MPWQLSHPPPLLKTAGHILSEIARNWSHGDITRVSYCHKEKKVGAESYTVSLRLSLLVEAMWQYVCSEGRFPKGVALLFSFLSHLTSSFFFARQTLRSRSWEGVMKKEESDKLGGRKKGPRLRLIPKI